MNLNQCHCVVTGASGATGTAIRTHLLEQGATVTGTLRPMNETQALKELNPGDFQIEMDPLDPKSIASAIHQITRKFQQIHVWVNVIGGFHMGEGIEHSPHSVWESMYAQNFLTALNCTQAILPHFKKNNAGRLINFGSVAVAEGMAHAGPYLTSKAAVHALSKATASELNPDITCNAILPGIIDTKANRHAMPDADTSQWVTPDRIAEQVMAFIQGSKNGELVVL